MVSSWLPRSALLLGLLSTSAALPSSTAPATDEVHVVDASHLSSTAATERRAGLRAATSAHHQQQEASIIVNDPVDEMIQGRKAGRRQGRKLKKDKKKKNSKKKSKQDDDDDKKDDDADKKQEAKPNTATTANFKQTATTTGTVARPSTSTNTGTNTGTTTTGQIFTLPPGVSAGYNNLPNAYYQGTSSGANTETNFQTWTVKDPSQVGRNPEGPPPASTVANVPMLSCEGGGGDDQDMTFFNIKFGQCSNADPCLAAVMPGRMAYYCPLQFRPHCGGKCYTVASACPDGKIRDAQGNPHDANDPQWWKAESGAWGGAWPYNFGQPACTHSAASF
mmetsp:Transcript_20038/g.57551  ORF Transcript_20038/g.57551 Transcript_20038/m.57551 type:complete len:335 (+) Transcript_20038:21-1025(+)